MNSPTIDPLTAIESAQVKTQVRALVTDGQLGESVSVLVQTGSTMNVASGTVTVAGSADSVTGYLAPVTLRTVPDGSPVQVGDSLLMVMAEDLTREPVTGSTFTVGSVVYRVVHCVEDTLGFVWHCYGRRTS